MSSIVFSLHSNFPILYLYLSLMTSSQNCIDPKSSKLYGDKVFIFSLSPSSPFPFALRLAPVSFSQVYPFVNPDPGPNLATEKYGDSGGHHAPRIGCHSSYLMPYPFGVFIWLLERRCFELPCILN